jgi:tetratricopeptide (TPR) repeat protein
VTGLWYYAKYQLDHEKSPEAALETLRRCERNSEGKHAPCLTLMADVLKRLGRNAEVIGVARRAAELDPGNRDLLFALGLAYIEMKNNPEAEKVFALLASRDPRDSQAIYNLAWLQMQAQNWDSARNLFLKAAELGPGSEGIWLNLKSVAQKLGDTMLVARCDQELGRLGKR